MILYLDYSETSSQSDLLKIHQQAYKLLDGGSRDGGKEWTDRQMSEQVK